MKNRLTPDAEVLQHVYITVAGGVAYVAEAPKAVRVHLIDYDDLKDDFDSSFSRLSPEARAFYRRAEADLAASSDAGHV